MESSREFGHLLPFEDGGHAGMDSTFTLIVAVVAAIAGAVASVAGFGIGSIVTPVMNLHFDTKLAVAAVSIPHFIGSAIRCWNLRKHVDRGLTKLWLD